YGHVISHEPVESVELMFWDTYLDGDIKDPAPFHWEQSPEFGNLFTGAPREQVFSYEIPDVSSSGYISLFIRNTPVLDQYLVLPGDSIKLKIDLDRGLIVFAGPSASHFECRYRLDGASETAVFGS